MYKPKGQAQNMYPIPEEISGDLITASDAACDKVFCPKSMSRLSQQSVWESGAVSVCQVPIHATLANVQIALRNCQLVIGYGQHKRAPNCRLLG